MAGLNLNTVTIINRTAQSVEILVLARQSCELVAEWYGAFAAGDDYDFIIDGVVMEKDIDGLISTDPAFNL